MDKFCTKGLPSPYIYIYAFAQVSARVDSRYCYHEGKIMSLWHTIMHAYIPHVYSCKDAEMGSPSPVQMYFYSTGFPTVVEVKTFISALW